MIFGDGGGDDFIVDGDPPCDGCDGDGDGGGGANAGENVGWDCSGEGWGGDSIKDDMEDNRNHERPVEGGWPCMIIKMIKSYSFGLKYLIL